VVQFANAAGAIAAARKGAQPSIGNQEDIEQFIKTNLKPKVSQL
jgi:sugar/nucleoside kinase (ribokinase family)